MSRLQICPMSGDILALQFMRGGTPTQSQLEFGLNYQRSGGGGGIAIRRFDTSGAGSAGTPTVTTLHTRLTFRCTRLPTQETVIWAAGISGEGFVSCCISVGATGLVRVFNQGNQATLIQPLGDCGSVLVNDWNTVRIITTTRSDAAVRLPAISVERTATLGVDGSFSVTLPVPGSGTGLQFNGGLLYHEQLFMVQSAFTATGDFEFADWVSDDSTVVLDSRITPVKVAANGTYQEFTVSGIADWRARNMWPYGVTGGPLTMITYGRRSSTVGQRQSYVFQAMSEVGITGTILGAVVSFSMGTGGAAAHTLIIRRNGVETTAVLWSVPINGWFSYRLNTTGWLATDTIEIGLQNASVTGVTIGSMVLNVEHTTAYVPPTDTSFTSAMTSWTGTGAAQTLTFPDGLRPDFVLWWPTTDTTSMGGLWHRNMDGSQKLGSSSNPGPTRTDFIMDGDRAYLVGNEVSGPNVLGRAYSAILLQDPTWRMFYGGCLYQNSNALYDGRTISLSDIEGEGFEPEFVGIVVESLATSANYMTRSTGNTGDQSSFFMSPSVSVANWIQSFVASGFTLGTAMAGNLPTPFFALRSSFIGPSFMSMSTYVGNGAAARDVTLNMPGYTPDWLYIQPSGTSAAARIIVTPDSVVGRDVSTGNVSSNTFYTRGENRVTVGLSLNANGVTYFVLAFAVGVDSEPEPPVPPDPYPGPALPPVGPVPSTLSATLLRLRRLRRSAHLTNEQFRVFFHRLQVDAQVGIGLSGAEQVGTDPQMMLRWSDDAGQTWSNEHWVSMGKLGQYKYRAIFNRLGQGRNRVFEVAVSDPVAWRIVDAFIQATPGNN